MPEEAIIEEAPQVEPAKPQTIAERMENMIKQREQAQAQVYAIDGYLKCLQDMASENGK